MQKKKSVLKKKELIFDSFWCSVSVSGKIEILYSEFVLQLISSFYLLH